MEYSLAGTPWEEKEDNQLIAEYTEKELGLLELCTIHKRLPGGIISRLKRLSLIDMKCNVRGYAAYQRSNLYKEYPPAVDTITPIIDTRKVADIQPKRKITSEIIHLKKEVLEIKENVSRILILITALYEKVA